MFFLLKNKSTTQGSTPSVFFRSVWENYQKMKRFFFAYLTLCSVLFFNACSKSSNVGADIFQKDNINLNFSDTFDINALAEPTESFVTLQGSRSVANSSLLGTTTDQPFGTTEAELGISFSLDFSVATANSIVATTSVIDSLVLELAYAPRLVYGDTLTEQSFSVYRVSETFPTDAKSDKKLMTSNAPLGQIKFIPRPITDTIVDTLSFFNRVSRFRIKLDRQLSTEIFTRDNMLTKTADGRDSIDFVKFRAALRGLVVKSDRATNCMLGVNFVQNISATSNPPASGMTLHFRTQVNGKDTARFATLTPFSWHTYLKTNRENSLAETSIRNENILDTVLLLQSGDGMAIKLELPTIRNLGKILVNRATLDFTIADSYDTTVFKPIPALFLSTLGGVPIEDFSVGSLGGTATRRTIDGKQVIQYALNIPAHLQRIVDGRQSTQLLLTSLDRTSSTARSIFYGSKSKVFPLKLRVFYTKI
ncbi:MAG: DUF4270 domain-containing protein [Saprospiraceae bacterium]|nr:DUF4270 domain-containing protein [Saprospiraceae bacterium]